MFLWYEFCHSSWISVFSKWCDPSLERKPAVANWSPPKSTKELHEVVFEISQLVQAFCQQICRYCSPPHPPYQQQSPFPGRQNTSKLSTLYRQCLVSSPILDFPTKTDKLILSTDAVDLWLGAVLSTGQGTVIENKFIRYLCEHEIIKINFEIQK